MQIGYKQTKHGSFFGYVKVKHLLFVSDYKRSVSEHATYFCKQRIRKIMTRKNLDQEDYVQNATLYKTSGEKKKKLTREK